MMITQKMGRNAPCPCGSGKKYKKCHATVNSKPPKAFDPELALLGKRLLNTLDDTASSIKVDRSDRDERFYRMCAYHHAYLVYGVTKAALALAQAGSRWPIFALRRLIYQYWLTGLHFEKNRRKAILYVASVPLLQRRFAEKWSSYDRTKDFSRQISTGNRIADAMVKEYPDLLQPKKGQEELPEPELVEWEPENLLKMSIAHFIEEAKEHPELAQYCRVRYRLGDDVSDQEAIKVFAKEKYLMNAEYPSQQIHGTALSLVPTWTLETEDGFARFSDHFDDPNPLVWGCLGFALGIVQMMGRVGGLDVAQSTSVLQSSLDSIAARLGIE